MFRKTILAAVLALLPLGASAQLQTAVAPLLPLGFCQLTLTGTAALISTCTGGIPAGAGLAMIVDETANSRWRDDGTAPTASAGMLLTFNVAGNETMVYTGNLLKLQFIAVSGSPVLDISFYATRF